MSRAAGWGSWFALPIAAALAAPLPSSAAGLPAQIAIILDDLGEQQRAGLRAVALPGPVACAFLPNTRHARAQAQLAHERGKEVLLHLPLEPTAARPFPTAITTRTGRDELAATLAAALASVPHVAGVNNHQGSLLTQLAEPMAWLMAELRTRSGLYFVDSRTSGASVAYRAARAAGVPAAERNVFLDGARGEAAVRSAFQALIAKAQRNERALAIGHPYPETFQVLEQELPRLASYGVELVAPSELIARQSGWRPAEQPLPLTPALTLATTAAPPALPAATSAAVR